LRSRTPTNTAGCPGASAQITAASYDFLIEPVEDTGQTDDDLGPMSKVPHGTTTDTALRTAISAKIGAGMSRRSITLLVQNYAVDNNPSCGRVQNGARRLPVELIPQEWRVAFLDALDALPNDRATSGTAAPGAST
jgi:hypothetical protein